MEIQAKILAQQKAAYPEGKQGKISVIAMTGDDFLTQASSSRSLELHKSSRVNSISNPDLEQ